MAIDEDLTARLRAHRSRWPGLCGGGGRHPRPDGFVFVSATGHPVSPSSLLRGWGRLLRRAGLPQVPFHATRHPAVTLMRGAGVSPRVASERLGHASVAMTMDRYSHVSEALRRDAATAVWRLLEDGPETDRVSNRVSSLTMAPS